MQDFLFTDINRTRVKFCGICEVEDAQFAESLGVDALGFVFYEKSPRFLSVSAAANICKQLRPFTTKVGLFVNAAVTEVAAILESVNLDLLQFHGEEPEEFCRQFNTPYIKAVPMKAADSINAAVKNYPSACGLLLDTFHHEKKGGTGTVFDWGLIPKTCVKPLILAGGLNCANVKAAIEDVRPYAVDVSSGIELHKTKKDFHKMRRFIEEVSCVERI